MTLTLTGSSALDFVEEAGASILLSRHADEDDPAADGLSWDEALEIVIYGGRDQSLVYVTITPESVDGSVWALAQTYPHTTS